MSHLFGSGKLIYISYKQVRGFPTIKFFPGGKKDGEAEDYDGGRTSSDIVNWALEKHVQNVPPPEVYQVITLKGNTRHIINEL